MVAQSCASKWTDESEFQLMWWRSTTGVPACKSPSRVRYQAGTSDGGQWSTACPEAVRFTVRFVQDAGGGCGDWEVRSIVETTAIETAGARAAPPQMIAGRVASTIDATCFSCSHVGEQTYTNLSSLIGAFLLNALLPSPIGLDTTAITSNALSISSRSLPAWTA